MKRRASRDPEPVGRERCLLVVVDMQDKLLPSIPNADALVAAVRRLVAFCDILGVPVLALEQRKLGVTVEPLREALGQARSPILKDAYGGFGEPRFVEAVAASGRDTLLLTGIEAHVCVFQTAMGALARGFRAQMVADAVGSRAALDREVGLARAQAAGVEPTSAEMLMFELMGRGGTDEFRRVLPLLKETLAT